MARSKTSKKRSTRLRGVDKFPFVPSITKAAAEKAFNRDNVFYKSLEKKDDLQKLEEERGEYYGDPAISHRAIGYAFRGVLQNRFHHLEIPEIPNDLVAELLAAFKIVRAARPIYRQDSYDDAQVYSRFGERFKKENEAIRRDIEEDR